MGNVYYMVAFCPVAKIYLISGVGAAIHVQYRNIFETMTLKRALKIQTSTLQISEWFVYLSD